MAFFAMVLTFLFGLSFLSVPVAASHLSDGDISLMTPMEYVQGNWTQYFKNWLGLYEADNHEVRGIRVDLPTYLHYQWFDVREDEHLSCLLEEDCEMPPKDDLTVGGVNNVTEEVSHCRTPIDHPLNTQQEVTGRYAILKQLTNFHHQHKWMAEKTLEDEVSTLGSISSLAKQSSYTDEMDQWREAWKLHKIMEAHMLMTIELAFMSFLALPLTIAGGPIAGPTAGAVAGGIGGAWAGTTALVTDGFAGNEHRNEALVADAQYWLAHQDRLMKETANFNLRHLFNGGRLGSGYDLADFFQFGSFLIDPDPQDLHRLTSVQQTSIALDRIWREDRVYIIAQMDPCNDGMLLRDIVGDVIEDSKMVCLPDDYPDLTFYVYSAPKDPKAAATSMTQERWYNDGLPRTHWARNVPGRELIDNGWNAMNWTDIVRSSMRFHERVTGSSGPAMGEKLVQDAVRFHEKKISGASFSIPVCVGAQGMAVHGKYAKTTMPDGVPCFCAGEDDGTNGASGRFLNQLGFPGPLDTPEPYTRNGDSDMPLDIGRPLASNPKIMKMMGVSKKQFEEMSDKMDEEARKQAEHPTVELSCPSRQTLQCFREDKKEGKTTETCSVRRFGGGWSVTVDVPNQVQECVRNIPRDDALGGIPTVLLGNDGCPVRDRAGNFVPMDLRGYENYDWQSKSWH